MKRHKYYGFTFTKMSAAATDALSMRGWILSSGIVVAIVVSLAMGATPLTGRLTDGPMYFYTLIFFYYFIGMVAEDIPKTASWIIIGISSLMVLLGLYLLASNYHWSSRGAPNSVITSIFIAYNLLVLFVSIKHLKWSKTANKKRHPTQ